MTYTNSITSKGQITIPKEFRDKLGLDKIGRATLRVNENNEIVITPPKNLSEVRKVLNKPTFNDGVSDKEQIIGRSLAKKYDVR